MIKSFDDMYAILKTQKVKTTIAVAAAQDKPVLEAVYNAYKKGICNAILVGDNAQITAIEQECGIPEDTFDILDISDPAAQCEQAVQLVLDGTASILMKGLVETPILLKTVLKHKERLLTGAQMNNIAVLDMPSYHKLLVVGDSAMIIAPTLEQKKQMIINALPVFASLGIDMPKIALICAKESADPKMPATIDAAALAEMNRNGELPGCIISGPIAMDVACDLEAAKHKGLQDEVAGDADYLVVSSLEAGNILYKACIRFSGARGAGIILGAKVPIVLTSRSDNTDTKMNSVALASLMQVL